MGRKVQIGHLYDGQNRKILTAYPRLFDENEFHRLNSTGESYKVSKISDMLLFLNVAHFNG